MSARSWVRNLPACHRTAVEALEHRTQPSITFAAAARHRAGSAPTGLAVSDLSRDGTSDLSTMNGSGRSVSVLSGNGDGTFMRAARSDIGAYGLSVAAGDFNPMMCGSTPGHRGCARAASMSDPRSAYGSSGFPVGPTGRPPSRCP